MRTFAEKLPADCCRIKQKKNISTCMKFRNETFVVRRQRITKAVKYFL